MAATPKVSGMNHSHKGGASKMAWWDSAELTQLVSIWMLWASAGIGLLALIAALVGGVSGYQSSKLSQADADKRLAQADERQRQADERISANEAVTAVAKADAAGGNARAAEANLEVQRLRKELSWRELTPRQAAALTAAVAPLRKGAQWNVVITFHPESETANFARGIAEALWRGGWSRDSMPMARLVSLDGPAIREGVRVAPEPRAEATAVLKALQGAGVAARLADIPKLTAGRMVGTGEVLVDITLKPNS
jgi:hypothetical protein